LTQVSSSRLVVLALATAFVIPLFMHSPAAADLPPGELYGGHITVAILASDAIDLNPVATGASSKIVHQLVYDSLMRKSADDLLPEAWLASSWAIDEVAKTITFQMRPEAKWSDGFNITPADVAANYQPKYVVTTGPSSVTINASPVGIGRFLGEDAYLPIAKRVGDANNHFSGPFWANETAADHVILAANPNHWNGRPYLDYIRYDYYANISLAACAFIERNATFIGAQLSSDDLNTVNYPCNRKIVDTDNPVPQLFTSMNPGLTVSYIGMNTAQAPLNDSTLRLAITKTVDRSGYPEKIKANSEIADSFVSPFNTYWFNVSAPEYRVPRSVVGNVVTKIFDEINAELELAGYMDWNFDGWRETPSKLPITLSLLRLRSETPAFVDTLENDIRSIGIKVDDVPLDTYADIMTRVQNDTFSLYLGNMQASQDPSFLRDYFSSTQIATGLNYFNYSSPTMDGLLNGADNAVNLAGRQKYVKDALAWIATDVPAAPILHFKALYVYDKLQYEGWVNQLGGINNFWSFYSLHAIQRGAMVVEVSALTLEKNRLNAGSSTGILVSVTNESGGLAGANVEITVSNGTMTNPIGVTDGFGSYLATYHAALVDMVTNVFITAKVTKPGHTEAVGQTAVAVYPATGKMAVVASLIPNTRNLKANEAIALTLEVTEEADSSVKVAGAFVQIAIIPDGVGGQLSTAEGFTDATGRFTTSFSGSVSVDTTFALQIKVTKLGYEDRTMSVGLIVSKVGGTPQAPGPDVVILVAVVALMAFAYGARRRGREEEPR